MATTTAPPTAPQTQTDAPVWHVLTREGATSELHVEPASGLTSDEAAERLARSGPNKFAEAKAESRWHAFLRQYQDPMQIVLLVAGVISIYPVKQPGTGVMILLLTLLNAVLGLNQEGKAAAAVAALAKMMIIKARVRRDGKLALLPAEELVPGDVVGVEAGDGGRAGGRGRGGGGGGAGGGRGGGGGGRRGRGKARGGVGRAAGPGWARGRPRPRPRPPPSG